MIKNNNIVSKVESEISSLDLREDSRKYINGFVQLYDNSVVDAIFACTENFYEDIKEICDKHSTDKLIFVPYDLDARCFVDINKQKLYEEKNR